jgi:hypothetical protein
MTIRARLTDALAGRPVIQPVYAVYDWFVINRPIDWPSLFNLGLGRIHHASLEQFSVDLAGEEPELLALLEMMNAQLLDAFRCAVKTKATQIKLWENLSIETMGPTEYRKHLVAL